MGDKMTHNITIPGRLPGYNEYINICRRNRYAGAKFKKDTETAIMWRMKKYAGLNLTGVSISFTWYEPNRRRDADNIISAKKFILDAMVKLKIVRNDNQKHVYRLLDSKIFIDKDNPRVEIEIQEARG